MCSRLKPFAICSVLSSICLLVALWKAVAMTLGLGVTLYSSFQLLLLESCLIEEGQHASHDLSIMAEDLSALDMGSKLHQLGLVISQA